jgi:hypothetical protein
MKLVSRECESCSRAQGNQQCRNGRLCYSCCIKMRTLHYCSVHKRYQQVKNPRLRPRVKPLLLVKENTEAKTAPSKENKMPPLVVPPPPKKITSTIKATRTSNSENEPNRTKINNTDSVKQNRTPVSVNTKPLKGILKNKSKESKNISIRFHDSVVNNTSSVKVSSPTSGTDNPLAVDSKQQALEKEPLLLTCHVNLLDQDAKQSLQDVEYWEDIVKQFLLLPTPQEAKQ